MSRLTFDQAIALAAAHRDQGRPESAEAICREILSRHPGHAQAAVMLASMARQSGRLDEATAVLLLALERGSDDAAALQALGLVERARGNLVSAIDWMQRALAKKPEFVEARNNLGLMLTEAGRPEAAVEHFSAALRTHAHIAELHYNLGLAYASLGRHREAAGAYRRATQQRPQYVEAHINLGVTLKLMGRLDSAVEALERAVRLDPRRAVAYSHLAGVYEWRAQHDLALAAHRRAMELAPLDAAIHSSYLFTLLFAPGDSATELRAAHALWNLRHAQPSEALPEPVDRDCSPMRRLRIGYVGGFFRDHILGRNLFPLFREQDRSAVSLYCYSSNRQDDALTAEFRRRADGWCDIGRMSDAAAAARIRDDGIDILVDTTLHMDTNRLPVFARRPAPVQVTFAGYPGSTGITAMNYRLTDPHLDPPGGDDSAYAEASLRLPDSFWCYDPLGDDVAVGPLAADRNGFVTFGCLNNFSKVNDAVLELWARMLRAVPESRLHLLCHEGSHRGGTLGRLAELGVDAQRVEFFSYRPRLDYLALFRDIDISLETLPYNGHTTSLDSLWMGVPLVTLVGDTVVGRAGLSQLTNLGLKELIARTPDEYEAIVTALAADRERLRGLRDGLRRRMEQSPLMDARRFVRSVEAAYRQMWIRWCASKRPVAR
jgi:predicted O-linked N-acetylglucosamine transferase (SPINDLY family)